MNVYTTRLAGVDAVASKGNALVDEEKNLSSASAAVSRAEAVGTIRWSTVTRPTMRFYES
jgi:hypothetical protein